MISLLFTILITGLVSNGVNLITGKNPKTGKPAIFYFAQKVYFDLIERIEKKAKDKTKEVQKQYNLYIVKSPDKRKIYENAREKVIISIQEKLKSDITKWTFIFDPLLLCPKCMASVWGTAVFWACWWIWGCDVEGGKLIAMWVLSVLSSAYFNTYLNGKVGS